MFFANPDLIFLDECFANLDPYNQNVIAENLSNFRKDRTVFIISHSEEVFEFLGERKIIDMNENK